MRSRAVTRTSVFLTCLTAFTAAPLAAHPTEPAAAPFARERQPAPPVSINVKPNWLDNRPQFWYLRQFPGTREWIFVDMEKGIRRPLFNRERLEKSLAAEGVTTPDIAAVRVPDEHLVVLKIKNDNSVWLWNERDSSLARAQPDIAADFISDLRLTTRPLRTRRNGESSAITFVNQRDDEVRIFWVAADGERHSYGPIKPGESRDQHTYAGHVWVVVAADGNDIGFVEGPDQPSTLSIDTAADPAPPAPSSVATHTPRRSPDESPDGKHRALIRDHNVVLSRVDDAGETPLTTGGTQADGFRGRVHWSPDSRFFVTLRTRQGDDRAVYYVQSSPTDQLQPRLKKYNYLKPGDAIPHHHPCLFDAAAGKEIPLDNALFDNPWEIRDLRWTPDSSRFFFLYNQRGHTVMRLLAVDPSTGAVTPIVNEECPTFFDYAAKLFVHHLDDSGEVIWMSERDGWNHLYLIDSRSGDVKNQITTGNWVVRSVERVDEHNRRIWFRAMGIIPTQDPYHVHFARINFDGTGLTLFTEGDGTHQVQYSPDGEYLLDTYSRVDMPPVTEVRRTFDGSFCVALEPFDHTLSTDANLPQRFSAKGRDGVTDIWGVIHRPPNFDPSKKYPVVEQIYAGPHDHHVPKSFRSLWGYIDTLTSRGFIVVQIDGMGTNWRSKKFHDVAWKNLKDAGFPDRIAWLKAAAAKHPELDLDNQGRGVGIYGGSAGGQNAMAALLWHGDFYKTAVADCGCHDNRMDKIWWNELWMSWPVGPHYEASSNVVNAHLMPRDCNLMLFVGEMDENVDPASTMQVVNALVKADRDFDLVVLPNTGHGSAESPYGRRRRTDFLIRHLVDAPMRPTH